MQQAKISDLEYFIIYTPGILLFSKIEAISPFFQGERKHFTSMAKEKSNKLSAESNTSL